MIKLKRLKKCFNMLDKKQKYLQIALNSNLKDARMIINQIPLDEKIIIEAGTPLIKNYGVNAIRNIRLWWEQRIFGYQFTEPEIINPVFKSGGSLAMNFLIKSLTKTKNQRQKKTVPMAGKKIFNPYIVADLKCMDRGGTEVQLAKKGGANAVVALGHAPIETLDSFIDECKKCKLDSMIDMMNVDFPLNIIRELKESPDVVILHRGGDEEIFDPESEVPYHEIQRIKGEYDIMVAVAGGDDFQEVQRAVFNDADIVVVWKSFYQSTAETAKIAEDFLKEIR